MTREGNFLQALHVKTPMYLLSSPEHAVWNHHIHNEQHIISLLAVLLSEQLGLQYWPGGYLAWDGDGVFLPATLGFTSFFTFFFGLLLSVFLTVFSPLNSPDSGSFLLLQVTGLSRWATASRGGSSCGKAPWEETSWGSPGEGLTRERSSWEGPQGEGSSWWRVPRIVSEGDKDGTKHLSPPGMGWLWDSWLTDAADRETHTAWGHAAELGDKYRGSGEIIWWASGLWMPLIIPGDSVKLPPLWRINLHFPGTLLVSIKEIRFVVL